MEKKYDIFISYSRKDSAIADKICKIFDAQEPAISYFIDRRGIDGAADFPDVLANAIDESKIVLFLGSVNSYKSDYTQKEVAYTISRKGSVSLFPLLLDDSKLPPSLELLFSNINWRVLGKSYTIEDNLILDIKKKIEDPHVGEIIENQRQKKNNYVLMIATVAFLIACIAILYHGYHDSAVKKEAIENSFKTNELLCSADSLLILADSLKRVKSDESRVAEELQLLMLASTNVKKAQLIKNTYVGTEYFPLFTSNTESEARLIDMKIDSMFTTWSTRALEAYSFYCRVGSKSEKTIAGRYAGFALQIRPEDERMNMIKTKMNE